MSKTLKSFNAYFLLSRTFANKPNNVQIDMKYLNVAEKNDAAKTIAGLLSNGTARRREGYSVYNKIYDFDYTVKGVNSKMVMTSVSGHLLEHAFLRAYKNWQNVDPISLFDAPIRKICKEDYQPIKRTLEREIRGCGGLIIWTDCDREGENIGFEIIDVCRAAKPNIPVYRAVFSEITAQAVKRALQNLKTPDKRQNDAVEVRAELDLRTGAAITRFQTLRFQRLFPQKIAANLISYGSCQIPTLGFVAERYKEIEAFVSEPFWKIKVIHTIDDLTVEFLWARNRLFDKQACEDFLLICLADPRAKVESVTVKPKSKWRPTPLDTVEMEKLGSRKLKLSAKETMTIAEKLYTKGIISYPRTETNQFTNEIDLRSLVEQQTEHGVWGSFAQRVMEWGPNPRNGNKSDQAHPPIHPTKLVTNLEGDEARVYELICRHFLACVSKDAVGSETVVHINIAGEKFTATGLVIFERNYLDVYVYDKWSAKQIHKYEEGQIFEPTEISMQEGKTTAPPLLTEADLIALMEKHGIGTDATHAEHINTIKQRGYVGVLDKGFLVPGVIGMGLYEGYDAMQLALAKPMLRAEFEADLKRICLGEKDPKVVLQEQVQKYKEAYRQIMERVTAMDDKMAARLNETPAARPENADHPAGNIGGGGVTLKEVLPCPKCKVASLTLKPKKNQTSFFIGCLNYPDCKNVVWLPEECSEPTILDESCERCGSNVKLIKVKLSTSYYRTLLNAPSGRYKTCLRCDAKFREAFNINLDSVKEVGRIVGSGESSSTASVAPSSLSAGPLNSAAGNQSSNSRTRGNQPPASRRGNGGDGNAGGQTRGKAASKKSTKPKTTNAKNNNTGGIRNFFTNAAPREVTAEASSAMATVQDPVVDAFFDSNDGFDDLLLSSDIATMQSEPNAARQATTAANEFDTEELAALIDTDFENDFLGDTRAESGRRGGVDAAHSTARPSVPRTTHVASSSLSNPPDADDSLVELLRTDEIDFDNFTWGTAARSRQREGDAPQSKRQRLEDSNKSSTTNWSRTFTASSTTNRAIESPEQSEVKCSGCQLPAKKLTVKKDGPNKGRTFFVCQQGNQCKFFQWADDEAGANVSTASGNTSNRNFGSTHSSSDSSTFNSMGTSSNNNNMSWGTRSASAGSGSRNAGPSTDFNENDNSFGWGTRTQNTNNSNRQTAASTNSRDNSSNDNAVKCNCGQAAKSLIVRKEGPNKNRPFYGCPNRTCNFFMWDDNRDNQASSSNDPGSGETSWGSGNRRTTGASNPSNRESGDSKKRKCGLCRQEGHTKLKCPRKAEFEF